MRRNVPITPILLLALSAPLAACAGVQPVPGPAPAPASAPAAPAAPRAPLSVRDFGARGDSASLATDAINRAIEAAAAAGGGTVYFPAGTYRSFSIHLRSHVSLYLETGATLLAATPTDSLHGYDRPEPGPGNEYQDFGHSHFHNSLIWGENVEDVTISGPGRIDGTALWNSHGRDPGPTHANKAIALKLARNITIRDISILRGGHFGILATGVDNLTIDNVKIDTNRDGIDIDACRNVRISNVSVNAPNDDGIVLKSSYALGFARATENLTLTNSFVSGYDVGSLLDGSYRRTIPYAMGRVKMGTESNGGFRNITISNIVFDHCMGLALESVDGAVLEDVTVTNLTMRDVTSAPLFLRLGARMRGPAGVPVGTLRRVTISNVVASGVDPHFAAIISGIPGHPIEDVRLSGIHLLYRGGYSVQQVLQQPAGGAWNPIRPAPRTDPYAVPEEEKTYPETSIFGITPAYGFYIRHVNGIELDGVEVGFATEDRRPPFVLQDVSDVEFRDVGAQKAAGVPAAVLRNVQRFRSYHSRAMKDVELERVERREL